MQMNPFYWWLFLRARYARKQGEYQNKSFGYFFRAWQLSGQIDDLLSYVLFRRDLGYVLPGRYYTGIQRGLSRLSPQRRMLAANLLLESQANCLEGLPALQLPHPEIIQSPATLFCINRKSSNLLTSEQRKWLEVFERQDQWRADFCRTLRLQVGRRGVCVVGNAGVMPGSGLGGVIDKHDCVVRFNTFVGTQTHIEDIGRKHTIWVVTPAFCTGKVPINFSGSVVLTGPDMRYRMLDWSGLKAFRELGLPLLTVPLSVWHGMVRELAAPPSAGLLFLAWLKNILGSWTRVSVAGFAALATIEAAYHSTDPKHKASSRHNWSGESVILRRWQNEGLKSLHD